jgi:hypothetical protein
MKRIHPELLKVSTLAAPPSFVFPGKTMEVMYIVGQSAARNINIPGFLLWPCRRHCKTMFGPSPI